MARQAIHHASGGVAAYELLFRQLSTDSLVDEAAHEAATAQVLSSVFGDFGVDDLAGGLPLFVNATRAFLVGDLPLPDGPDRLVVEVLEHVAVDAQVLQGVGALTAAGYRIAADDWDGCPSRDALIRVCDVVKIDVAAVGQAALPRLVERAHVLRPGVSICVERVEDADEVALAVAAGADLLQGYALHRPQTRTTRTLTSSEVACLRLLGALAGEADTSELVRLVTTDPGLALQVMRMAASPAGVGRPVRSIQQAVALLGPRKLGSWVVLMLLGGAAHTSRDDMITLLARAGACALLVPGHHDTAYTAGLLSAVADVLGGDPVPLVRDSGAGPLVAQAVLHGAGPVGAALHAVLAHENNDLTATPSPPHQPYDVSRAYLQALADANHTATAMTA